jgi:hypothetical protein
LIIIRLSLRANFTNNEIVIRHAGVLIAGVGSVCHPSLIQVNGLGVTERYKMQKYIEMTGIDSNGDQVSLQLPTNWDSFEILTALQWYFDNGWTLSGSKVYA